MDRKITREDVDKLFVPGGATDEQAALKALELHADGMDLNDELKALVFDVAMDTSDLAVGVVEQ